MRRLCQKEKPLVQFEYRKRKREKIEHASLLAKNIFDNIIIGRMGFHQRVNHRIT
jgi:hypothetical protein